MMLKNYRYVFILTHVVPLDGQATDEQWEKLSLKPAIYADKNSLPSRVTSSEIRKAEEKIGEAVFSPGTMSFLTYCPIQGR
jgi:hypothetical protein